jgi:predicted DNA-binding transcriptional regulator YafY
MESFYHGAERPGCTMNRTDRLLAIVLELQAHGSRRAEDLAEVFEVSKRTIYRDVQALCEAGVPVVAEVGRGYSLPAGYFLPPLRFSADEALMLILGADVMAQSFDAEYRHAAADAARKIAGALPPERGAEVRSLRESLEFVEPGSLSTQHDETMRALRGAIVAGRTTRFVYTARYGAAPPGSPTTREADPYGLARVGGSWYLVAFCHLRGAIRNFRLDRIADLQVLERRFTRPPDFVMGLPSDERPLTISAMFDGEAARWVREAPSFYITALNDTAEGLLATLQVRRLDEALPWLLSWGRHVRVLAPPELVAMVAAEARVMLAAHGGY